MFVVVFSKSRKKGFWKTLNGYFLQTAIDIDKFANRNFRTLWNSTLINWGGYKFGNVNETISSALGKNKKQQTLSRSGRVLAGILDFFDKDHCIKSINYEVN